MTTPSPGKPIAPAVAARDTSGESATELLRDGRYSVVGVLGSGSQGETLEAVDKREGRLVAVKRFTIRGAKSWKDVELAEREATVLASLSHPSLPRYIEHFEERGALYLVMEKVEGETLAARRKRGAALDQSQVMRFLKETGECLRYLHGHAPPIVHRDIKPGNVILRPDGSYCLVDFGSVRDRLKPEGGSTVVGTFGFMAPEQFQGRAGPGSDVYATAATALSLLTGSEPEDLPHKGLSIDVEAALGTHADRRLVAALRAMLEPDPDRRETSVVAALGRHGLGAEPAARARSSRAPNDPGWAQAAKQERRARLETEGFWQGAEQVREHVRRETLREMKRELKRERKAARRAERHARRTSGNWHRPGRPVPPGIALGLFILLTLRVASVATFALFQVLLPTLFSVLTVVAGRRMAERSQRMIEIGRAGQRGLTRASEHVRYQFLGGATPDELQSSAPRQRVSIDADAEELELEEEQAAEPPKRSTR